VESAPKKRGNPYRDANGKFCNRSEAVYIVDSEGKLKQYRGNPYHDEKGKFAKGSSSGKSLPGGTSATGQAALDAAPMGLVGNNKDKLTKGQTAALNRYNSHEFVFFNNFLRERRTAEDDFDRETVQVINDIDSVMANSKLTKDVTVHRGIRRSRRLFGDSLNGDLTGFEWKELGYSSTTAKESVIEDFAVNIGAPQGGTVKMKVNVKKGLSAVQLSGMNGQAELMLGHDVNWKITKDHGIDPVSGHRVLEAEVS
jgi:hypothetical protein